MKKCCSCLLDKEEIEFAFRNKSRGIRVSKCKECQRIYAKTHYRSHKPDYIRRSGLQRQKNAVDNQQLLLSYLNGKCCIDCGNSDCRVLEFDHRDPSQKTNSICRMIRQRSWNRILKEIEKCDIRCANCHRIKTMTQFNHFRNKNFAEK